MVRKLLALLAALILGASAPAPGAKPPVDTAAEIAKLDWREGPLTAPLTTRAQINVPAGMLYLGSVGTSRFLQLNGNPPTEDSFTIAPHGYSWFAVMNFEESGYVKDEETIDAAKILETLRDEGREGNVERKRLGMSQTEIAGWAVLPHYERATHNLEWATDLKFSDGGRNINYTTRLLGRHGVMHVILVTDPARLTADLAQFRQVMSGFAYTGGERYQDFAKGDKVAEYGLAALITGGAAAAVVKTGLLAGLLKGLLAFIKPIIVGVVALFAALRRRIFGTKAKDA